MTDDTDADDGSGVPTDIRIVSEEPIDGDVKKTEWVDRETILAKVETDDGEIWYETYEFAEAER